MMKRWLLRTLAVVGLLLVVLVAFAWLRSTYLLHRTWHVHEAALALPTDAPSIAQGQHLAVTRGCTDCHRPDMGGGVVVPKSPIGQIAAPNLTRGKGGVVATFAVADWERAIRHGLRPDGRALILMPSDEMNRLSDADAADLIAWLRQLPPVDRATERTFITPLGRALLAFGQLPVLAATRIDQRAPHVAAIAATADATYGAYLAQGCVGCHGAHLSGGAIPGMPPNTPKAANLTPDRATGLGAWSKADFYRVLREGRKPDGSAVNPLMPWESVGKSSDTELDALWAYLRSVPSRQAGQR